MCILIIFAYELELTKMKLLRIFCVFLLCSQMTYLYAQKEDELLVLRQRAAIEKSLEGYLDVCRYLYHKEGDPNLLSLYADSIRQLGIRTKSSDCFIEYYIWKAEACFNRGDFEDGYASKRKAIALAEKTGKKNYIVSCSSDMGYSSIWICTMIPHVVISKKGWSQRVMYLNLLAYIGSC